MSIQEINRMYDEIQFAKKCGFLSLQQHRTLKGQIKSGNWIAAEKGLETILRRTETKHETHRNHL